MVEQPITLRETRLSSTLAVLTFSRLLINAVRRFPYSILTPMAAALGVPRATLEAALSALWAMSIFSPIAGTAADRIGRKRVMLFGMGCLALFSAVAAIAQVAGIMSLVLIAFVATGISKLSYDPAMQAYVGDRTPYHRRGTAIGITELAWSGSLFIFGPLAAFLITQAMLGAIFGVLAGGSLFALFMLWRIIPNDDPIPSATVVQHHFLSPANFRLLFSSRPALALLAVAVLMSIGQESISIVYEEWLRNSFALTTLVIGGLAFLFAVAEASGEGAVIFLSDRIGKRRLLIAAFLGCGVVFLALPLLAGNTDLAIALLFAMFLIFEIGVVTEIPLATEVLPQARGIMLSSNVAAFSIGRAIGTLLGGWMFRTGGMAFNGVFAAVMSVLSAGLVWRYVLEHESER